ncbi:hypothetical protein CYMTET_10407 [Cymbomonas tetramitiformis]|uniref:Uncharacterized protein n=1 Tax=Cymbomonas tetramitiformis TaxID=36881 RepID=A0AAE0GPE6_9CHLO|nr:hypothetical protein CYMTET_10407 [Cymbomonas tetramitiformis]
MVQRALNGPSMLRATPEDKKAFKKNSRPDWHGMYEELHSFLRSVGSESGTPSEAYSWLMEPVEENGKMASRFVWLLKSTEEHDGAVDCADQPFPPLDRDAAWVVVARKATAEDAEGEVADEYLHNGNSLVGLTGWKRRSGEHHVLMGPEKIHFPAGKGDVEWKDLDHDMVRVQDKIKDEVEEWSLSIVQDLLRRQSCPYSVYELKNFGIDLNAVVAAIRAEESKKGAVKEKPETPNPATPPEGGGTEGHSAKRLEYQKRQAALAESRTSACTGGNKQVPPPGSYSPKDRKACDFCMGGWAHADRQGDCWVGSKTSKCPSDYLDSRINSARPDVRQNAQMRIFNTKYRFPRDLPGFTTKKRSTMTDAQKSVVGANAADGQPNMSRQFENLAKELKDKLVQEVDDIKSREEFENNGEPLSASQGHVHVTLGSVKKIQGFTPMTPEEHKEGNPLRSTRPADYLEKEVTLVTSLLASVVRAFTQITAVLHHEGRLDSKKSSNVLGVIEEMKTTWLLPKFPVLPQGLPRDACYDLCYTIWLVGLLVL